jgi:nucleotide-binding universal stress UspA family protein
MPKFFQRYMAGEILAAVDGSQHSYRVIEEVAKLAKSTGSKVLLLYVVEKLEAPPEFAQYVKIERIEADPDLYYRERVGKVVLEKLGNVLKEKGVEHEPLLEFGNPADRIQETADARKPSYIVVGVVGLRGIRRVMALGSVARRVIENAKTPVVVVP